MVTQPTLVGGRFVVIARDVGCGYNRAPTPLAKKVAVYMWDETKKEVVIRLRWLIVIILDAALMLGWAYVADFANEFMPSQLPNVDKRAIDFILAFTAVGLLIIISAQTVKDTFIFVLRLYREVRKELRSPDE